MSQSFCGADCAACPFSSACRGCMASDGHPFGEACMVAVYCKRGCDALSSLKQALANAFNALQIPDLPQVTELFALRGAFINLEFPLPGGGSAKFWHDDRIYLGTQLPKPGTNRCYGLAGDEHCLMVCEYGANGADPILVLFKRWQ